MFRWYEMSQVCYAYLSDVTEGDDLVGEGSSFRRARWFSRGWTLQELIAPGLLKFYDSTWGFLGTRYALRRTISEVTGVDERVLVVSALNVRRALRSVSVAHKMSWAAGRSTSRPEDLAYCLLGIFEVNMPMLYGEGARAFARLQEEIIKNSHDQTILAWGYRRPIPKLWGASQALAKSPADFTGCSELLSRGADMSDDLFCLTQHGLQLHLPMIDVHGNGELLYCILNCTSQDLVDNDPPRLLALPLLRIEVLDPITRSRTSHYIRLTLEVPLLLPSSSLQATRRTVHIPRVQIQDTPTRWRLPMRLAIEDLPPTCYIAGIYPPYNVSNSLMQLTQNGAAEDYILIHFAARQKGAPGFIFIVKFSPSTAEPYATTHTMLKDTSITPQLPTLAMPVLPPQVEFAGNNVREIVHEVVLEAIGLGDECLDDDAELASLGIDSLASLTIMGLLNEKTGLSVNSDVLDGCTSLREVARNLALLARSASIASAGEEAMGMRGSRHRGLYQVEARNPLFCLMGVPEDTSLLEVLQQCRESDNSLEFECPKPQTIAQDGDYQEVGLTLTHGWLCLNISWGDTRGRDGSLRVQMA